MEIWGRTTSSNVQKVLWCCSELNLSYQRHDVGREFGGNRTPEYLAMNPNGLVPTIRDGDFVIWESNTIMRYLASRYDGASLYPQALGQRSEVDRWLDWQLSTLAPAIFQVFWGLIRTPPVERNNEAIAAATVRLTELWQLLDHELSRRNYAAGDQLTLADIAFGSSIHRWFALPIERPNFVHLKAWHDRIAVRPGFREHIAKPLV
jgi:glutathione S-transferase